MHVTLVLPFSLLSLLFLPSLASPPLQDPVLDPLLPPLNAAPTTLVDILTTSPNHLLLMRLLQRTKLIPMLNMLNNSALFAPDDQAISQAIERGLWSGLWREALMEEDEGSGIQLHSAPSEHDNIQYELRQHILYHVMQLPNYYGTPRPKLPFPSPDPASQPTWYYPVKPIAGPSPNPPSGPPWLPLPGGTLAGMPQRLRVFQAGEKRMVDVDWKGEGGYELMPIGEATNGEVWSVGTILPLPYDLANKTLRHPALSFTASNLPQSVISSLYSTPNLTVFLPTDAAFSNLTSLERGWLSSGLADEDWGLIVNAHVGINVGEGVGWVEMLQDGDSLEVQMLDGSSATLQRAGSDVSIGGVPLVDRDIYASNGVLHTLTSFLFPTSRLALTPEKTLVALNATSFVRFLHSANLTHYIDGSLVDAGEEYTVLAVTDQEELPHLFIPSPMPGPPEDDDPDGEGKQAKRAAYHVLKGKLRKEELVDGMLVSTELREEGLGGDRQRLRVGVGAGQGGLAWGDARVIGEPVETSNVLIYFISHLLNPPPSSVSFLTSHSHLSTFTTSLYATHTDTVLGRTARTTLLVPLNDAWDSTGLVGDWLLSTGKKAREDLTRVVQGHVLSTVLYISDIGSEKPHQTLEGGLVGVGRVGTHDAIGIRVPESKGEEGRFVLRDEEGDEEQDGLTRTGVVHEVDTLLVPKSVKITLGKMARGARADIMRGLVARAGYQWVLDGDHPPLNTSEWPWPFPPSWDSDDDDYDDDNGGPPDIPDVPYTLLLPTDAAFSSINLTSLLSSPRALQRLVEQHLIPTPHPPPAVLGGPPIALSDNAAYKTLLSTRNQYAGLTFEVDGKQPASRRTQPAEGAGWTVRVRGLSPARVLRWGRTSTPGGGAMLIDRVLEPYRPDWWERMGPPVVAGAVGGVLIVGFWVWVVWVWRRSGEKAVYEVLEGEED